MIKRCLMCWNSFGILVIAMAVIVFAIWGCGKKEKPSESEPAVEKKQAPTAKVVDTYPEDGGSLWELDHPIYVDFSEAVMPKDFSFTISPDPGQWKVLWQNDGKEAVLDHASPFSPGTEYVVTISLGKDGVKTNVKFIVFGPSSLQLIQIGQDMGTLDLNTAWAYRMQALFEPDLLPEPYRSATPIKDADAPLREFFRIRDRLSEQTLLKLRPYLVRPNHPESIFYEDMNQPEESKNQGALVPWPANAFAADPSEVRPDMDYNATCFTTDRLLVWAPKKYKSAVKDAIYYLDVRDMYRKFTRLMGREVIDDYKDLFQRDGANDKVKNGGDARIDIYMVSHAKAKRGNFGGMCIPTAFESLGNTNVKSSAYILIDRSIQGDLLGTYLAHELFHAFQYSFDALDDSWWHEATANWAEDFIDKYWNFEQDDIKHAFNRRKNRLRSLNLENEKHEYGIYIYPYFLSKEYGNEVIADIWKACETKSSLDALDEAVPDGLDESLKRFVLPTVDYGKYKGKIRKPEERNMALYRHHKFKQIEIKKPGKPISKEIKIPPLGAAYILVKNKLKNPESTPMVRFDLKPFANNEDLTIQAIIDPKKEARHEDWTGREERELCQNRTEEKFEEITIVVANKDRDPMALDLAHANPEKNSFKTEIEIELDAEGCSEMVGTAIVTATLNEETHTKWEHRSPKGDVDKRRTDLEADGRATVRLTFEKKDSSYDEATKTVTKYYDITDSTVTSFTLNGRSYYYTYDRNADSECACTKKQTAKPALRSFDIEDSGGMSITFNSETMKAKYVALPALVVYYDVEETTKIAYEGCCGSEGDERTMEMKRIPFVVGSVQGKSGEQLAKEAKPELDQMERIARDSQRLAQEIIGSMGQMAGMDDEQAEEFYKKMEKKTEEFEKRHNIDKLAQNMEKKLVPKDLWVTSGDGEHSIGGGGKRVDQKKIENGTTSREYELKWRINLKEKPTAKE